MSTHVIKSLMEATLTVTNTNSYDVLLLPESEGTRSAGQVISIFGWHSAGLMTDLESYALALGKSDATLSIGGNYTNQKDPEALQLVSYSWETGKSLSNFAGPFTRSLTNSYNIFHVTYNQEYDSGAVKFTGSDAKLILTAQNGAGNADVYSTADGYDAENNRLMKTDDNIAIRSEAYGMYSPYNDKTSQKYEDRILYGATSTPTAPNTKAVSYAIHATDQLTVVSDLAGRISSTAAALHTGYWIYDSKTPKVGNDASGREIVAAGIKADTLLLDANFRANITAENNQSTFQAGLSGARTGEDGIPEKYKLYKTFNPTASGSSGTSGSGGGEEEEEEDPRPEYIVLRPGTTYGISNTDLFNTTWDTWGTTIAAVKSEDVTASDNKVNSYGIWTASRLETAENAVWAGSISADTSDVRILADARFLIYAGSNVKGTTASAVNNEIGAYGIRSEGSLKIGMMDGLKSDDVLAGNGGGDMQYATISATARNNLVLAYAIPFDSTPAVASVGGTITAAAVYTDTLELGIVTDMVSFNAATGNNQWLRNTDSSSSGSTRAYGIYAATATLGSFDGNVTVLGTDSSTAAGLYVTGSLTAKENLKGYFSVDGSDSTLGIYANSITVSGAVDSYIHASASSARAIGIYTNGNLTASAFTGHIESDVGMNVKGRYASDLAGDNFDIAGNIFGGSVGIVSGGALNLRISGTVRALTVYGSTYHFGSAILADGFLSTNGSTFTVTDRKYADKVELASTATVMGGINLGDAETNTLIVSNAATFVGGVENTTARLNLTFNLEEVVENHAAITIVNSDDASHYGDTFTLTVNLNYAEEGETYNLYRYYNSFDEEKIYWKDRQISFQYQGCSGALTLSLQGDGTLRGSTDVKDVAGNVYATVSAAFSNVSYGTDGTYATFSVTVDDIYSSGEGDYDAKTPAALEFDYTDPTVANYVTQTYDAEKNTLKLNWKKRSATETYNLADIAAYEIEYILYDDAEVKLGNSIVARVDGTVTNYTIQGVGNNTRLDWRMRVLGDDSANTVTAWSSYYTVSNEEDAPVTTYVAQANPADDDYFKEETLTTKAVDASPRAGVAGIESAVADLSWTKMESANPVRNYIIEYVMYDQQLTRGDLDENITLEEYIAGNGAESFFDDIAGTKTIYRKTVTGTKVSVSDLQNASFVYWRIKAVDSSGVGSNWVAGSTFRVWTNSDTTAPVFLEKDRNIGVTYDYTIPDDVTGDAVISGKIGWNAAKDMESGVRAYIVELSKDGGKTYEEWKTVSSEDLKTVRIEGTDYDYSLSLDGLTGPQLHYRIKAVDYFGKEGEYISGGFVKDAYDPVFSGKSSVTFVKDDSDPSDVNITPTITWAPAADGEGELGIRYYSVELRIAGEDAEGNLREWNQIAVVMPEDETPEGIFSCTGNALDANKYEYRIVAFDHFGRTATLSGTFGSEDMDAPTGSFGEDSTFRAVVSATFGTKTVSTTQTDDSGKETTTTEEVVDPSVVEDATVVLRWSDNFTDPSGLLYRVIVQNDEWVPTKSYEFWTTPEDGKSITFTNDMPGRPVGIFETLKDSDGNIWWRVEAYDTNYNKAGSVSTRYSFKFTDSATGYDVKNSAAPAAPTAVVLQKTFDAERSVYTDEVSLQWNSPVSLLGIYSYTVTLKGKNYSYSKDTVDLSAYMTTDLDSDIEVTNYETYNTLRIADLKKFFGVTTLAEDEYTVVVTANDASGRTAASDSRDLLLDITPPPAVNFGTTTAFITPNNEGGTTDTCAITLSWDAVPDASGIDYYLVYRRELTKDAQGNVKMDWNDPKVKKVKVYGKTTYTEGITVGHAGYDYRIIAVDKAGNVGAAWAPNQSINAIPTGDLYGDSLTENVVKLSFDANSRAVASDTVGMGDPADVFAIDVGDKTMSLNLTAKDFANIPVRGTSQTVRIDIYEGSNTSKVWKSYTVREDSRVFSNLLLKADTTYTFKVANTDKNSISHFGLVFDKADLDIDVKDNTYALANGYYEPSAGGNYDFDTDSGTYVEVPEGTGSYVKPYELSVDGDIYGETVFSGWVGFGDPADVRILKLENSGRYEFVLSDVALSTKLTVYEVQSGGKIVRVGSPITATQASVNRVSTAGLLLDENKTYYVEVAAGSASAIGSTYNVSISCVESYPAPTTDDDKSNQDAPVLELSEQGEPLNEQSGWVTFTDPTDYYQVRIEDEGQYTVRLAGTNGKEISAAIGYVDANGTFRALMTKTGAADTESLILSRNFTQKELDKYGTNFFVKVYTNGANANSAYRLSCIKNEDIAGFNNNDDRILTKKQEDAAIAKGESLPVYRTLDEESGFLSDWVGLGDASDYWKLDLDGKNGLYDIDLFEIENGVKATLYQAVKDADGNVTKFTALKTVTKKPSGDYVPTFEGILLNSGEDYYVGITATGAASGQNSCYEVLLTGVSSAVNLGNIAGDEVFESSKEGYVNDSGWSITLNAPVNGTDGEDGGGYKFALDASYMTGTAKLIVYELLTTGAKRTVKTITVKAGDVGDTGYLMLDDAVVKNGTGIYQVQVMGANAASSGHVTLNINGYEFAKYLDEKDGAIVPGTKNWVGKGDAADEYTFSVTASDAGVRSLNLAGINGNNIKLSVIENGKVKKTFTPGATATDVTWSYDFLAGKEYTVKVFSADNGVSKFSEYVFSMDDRTEEKNTPDNNFRDLFTNSATTGADVSAAGGWVGLSDAKDYYKLDVQESGNYVFDISNLQNDVKVFLYEATKFNDDGSVKTTATLKSLTAKGTSGEGKIGNLYLTAGKEYYVMVQAAGTDGTKDTEYSWTLNSMTGVRETFDSSTSGNTTYYSISDSVGNGGVADYYQFTAGDGATGISLDLTGTLLLNVTATLWKVDSSTGKYTKITAVTAAAKSRSVTTGDLSLVSGETYVIEVSAPTAGAGVNASYNLTVKDWAFSDFLTDNNSVADATQDLAVGGSVSSAVWTSGDQFDYYRVDVADAGSYSLELSGFNGAKIKVSIGTLDAKGSFKALQSITGKAGVEKQLLSRNLDADTTYYVKVESVGNNAASQYDLSLTCNSADSKFSNADDTWKLVAMDVDAVKYNTYGTEEETNITNWVGFGDPSDYFKLYTDENSQVLFRFNDFETKNALVSREITLALYDEAGKSVALTFDSQTGIYTSKTNLMADREYYLAVNSTKPKEVNTFYSIAIDKR